MRASELRYYATAETPTETQNAFGEPLKTWSEVARLWLKKEETGGAEAVESSQLKASVRVRFTGRYRTDLAPQMRLLIGGQVYEIEGIMDPDGRRREIVIETRTDPASPKIVKPTKATYMEMS